MLMSEMKQGQIARITKALYPMDMDETCAYIDVIVLRMYDGHGWAFLAPSHHRGNGFMEGAGPAYEVELVHHDMRFTRPNQENSHADDPT